ncbi:unnamed protein product [Aureobasidium uvarum]|uniref:Uncharacterized protein n=1 Tax=Aureobasidium uvarum TaxID=2773716 RepID=A0A9N8KME1_9PEZI|nr:unnamed protein product [Aureobasidium uvarum]
MGSSKSPAPLVEKTDMACDTSTGWSMQHSADMMPNNGQQFGAMPMDFEFSVTAQSFGSLPEHSMLEDGLAGYEYSNMANMNGSDMVSINHFNGDFEETMNAKTPGYHGFDTNTADYHSSAIHNSSPTQTDHTHQPYGAHTPFDPSINTYDAKTPYVAPNPYTSSPHHSSTGYAGGIPDLDLDQNVAQPSEDFFPEPGPARKTPTPRKAKTKAKAAIAGDAEDTDEGRSLLSARGKGRGEGKGKAKAAVVGDEEEEEIDEDGESPATGSSTKAKGRKRAAAPPTPKSSTPSRKKSTKKATSDPLNTMGHQRLRKAPKNGIAQFKPIPSSFEECDIADQTLITMRDARYAELEGIKHGSSTIPNRYERLKTAFVNMVPEDNLRLFNIKAKLEDNFNKRKWALIAAEITKDGGAKYDPDDLRRRFKQLMEKSGFAVEDGLAKKDVDFNINADDNDEEDEGESPGLTRKQPQITWTGDDDDEDDTLGGAEQEDYEDTSYLQHNRRDSRESARMDVDDDEYEGGDSLAY